MNQLHNYFYFYYYSIVSGIALGVYLIINWHQLIDCQNIKSHAGAREFWRFLVCLLIFFVMDVMWGIFAGLKCPRILYADTVLFFLAMAHSVFFWARFVEVYLEMGARLRRVLKWTGRGLLAFFIAALVVNFFTGQFFIVDAQCMYKEGPFRNLALLLLIAFNALCSGMTLFKLRRTAGSIRRRNKMVFAFGVTMTVAILLQLGDPFLPIYALGCLFGCCLLHVFVIEDERVELHHKEILVSEYKARLTAERTVNETKSLFFSTVSHDIRTPLNAIVGFSELLEQGTVDEAERARYVATIRSSAKVLSRLVNDILDLSKLESGKLEIIEEPTDVPTLAREVIFACEVVRARKSLALKTEIGEMPWMSLDPQRIRQILFNLLSNAYKYTERGTITVRVRWQDGTLTLSVEDTGKGISKDDIHRILQPFVQVVDKNHRDGTGLGLPICQKLATLMGGELTVASEVNVGSTFTVTLPNVRVVEPPVRRSVQSERPSRVPSSVLVVDDSSVNRAVLKAMLAKSGVTNVTMAENGREALAALKGGQNFDLVLSDLWMPEMDGYELVRAIRADEKLSCLPVYLITADVEARNQIKSSSFTDILFKPITLEKIQALFV